MIQNERMKLYSEQKTTIIWNVLSNCFSTIVLQKLTAKIKLNLINKFKKNWSTSSTPNSWLMIIEHNETITFLLRKSWDKLLSKISKVWSTSSSTNSWLMIKEHKETIKFLLRKNLWKKVIDHNIEYLFKWRKNYVLERSTPVTALVCNPSCREPCKIHSLLGNGVKSFSSG